MDGTFSLRSITTEAKQLPPRVILLGTPKVGKTTWAAAAPAAVLLPVKGEEGADDMTCAKFPTAQTFDDVLSALQALATEPHEYRFVVIDSATALERLIWTRPAAPKTGRTSRSRGSARGMSARCRFGSG